MIYSLPAEFLRCWLIHMSVTKNLVIKHPGLLTQMILFQVSKHLIFYIKRPLPEKCRYTSRGIAISAP